MTKDQFRAALEKLELSQMAAASLFNANPRTVRKWALGETGIPPTLIILLRLLLKKKLKIADVERAGG